MSRFGPAATAIIALAITMPSVAAAEQRPTEVSGGAQSSPLPNARTQDEDFLRTAPGLLYPEIEASKLGAEKARDPQVQALSRRMAESDTELARKLEDAARSAGLEFAHKEDPHGVHRLQRLQDTGPQFDLAFLAEEEGWRKSW